MGMSGGGGIRTLTGSGLSALPLPLGYAPSLVPVEIPMIGLSGEILVVPTIRQPGAIAVGRRPATLALAGAGAASAPPRWEGRH